MFGFEDELSHFLTSDLLDYGVIEMVRDPMRVDRCTGLIIRLKEAFEDFFKLIKVLDRSEA